MKFVYDWLIVSFMDNLYQCKTRNLYGNLLFGLMVSVAVCFFLHKGAAREDSYYEFDRSDVLPTLLWLSLGILILAPPFPLREKHIIGIMAMTVCFVVFGITSYTDQKTGHFTAGYMITGVLMVSILFLFRLPELLKDTEGRDWQMLFICVLVNLILGLFAYRFSDVLLYLMGELTIVICMEPFKWMAAILAGLVIAMFTRFVRTVFEWKKVFIDKTVYFPFTIYLFIGVLGAFFLME